MKPIYLFLYREPVDVQPSLARDVLDICAWGALAGLVVAIVRAW